MRKIARIARQASKVNKNYSTGVVIVSAVRTPIGSFGGKLASFSATKLGALAVKQAIERSGVSISEVEEVILGNVVGSGLGQAPARQAAIHGGLPVSTVCTTVNKVCSSGLKTVMYAANEIRLGSRRVILTGGFESMSNIPYYQMNSRWGSRYGNGVFDDGIIKDGLNDTFQDKLMGVFADQTARDYGISREDQDKYSLESYRRAAEATKNGAFTNEIFSVSVTGKKGTTYVTEDEEFSNLQKDKISTLKPAFGKDGTVTAFSSSKLSDGASCLMIMSEEKAKKGGFKPLARILGYGDAEKAPQEFTTAPSLAIPIALKNAGIKKENVDLFEINEAFACVALANMKIMDLDHAKLNVNGGAVSLGHPLGNSGSRILVTLLHALKNRNKTIGVVGICNGGGGSSSMVIENL
jgi:acetyl-CoA C-acetyltransferase